MTSVAKDNKDAIIAAYNYTVKASLITNDDVEDLITETISDVLLNFEYGTKHMPTIYIGIKVNTKLYNKLVKNKNDATIKLSIYKYNKNSTTQLQKPYIEDNFVYEMNKDTSYNTTLVNETFKGSDSTGQAYKKGYIALIKIQSLNDNKKQIINGIVRNINLSSLIYTYTKHMNMVIEPISNNVNISQLVLPPMDSITKFLEYLDLNYAIYNSGYRYFRDFDKTYLLSCDGNPVSDGTNSINTIIIKIADNVDAEGNINSTQINIEDNSYVITIDSSRVTIDTNTTKEKSYNKIVGVTTDGKVSQYDINIPKNKYSTEKVKIQRVNNENTRSISAQKNTLERTNVMMKIVKTELDGSMLTPNKEYIVKNKTENRKYDGRYLLVSKKEILLKQEGTFISAMSFDLTKVEPVKED